MKRVVRSALAILLVLLLCTTTIFAQTPIAPQPVTGTLTVTCLDVGQADSILIELPNGQTMLIDAGNNNDGPAVVAAIRAAGHEHLDYVVATHPHEDHIGGMDDVINAFTIGKFYLPQIAERQIPTTQTFESMLDAAAKRGVRFSAAKAGVEFLSLPNLTARFVAPVGEEQEELNDYSAVLRLVYGKTAFLFAGDAEAASEAKITEAVSANVLKVGHHGSDSSTTQTFLDRIAPAIALVSVGKDNSYGHPSPAILARLEQAGVAVYRTDLLGAITVTSDGEAVAIKQAALAPVLPQAPPAQSQASAIASAAPAVTAEQDVVVYVTKTGEKYHRSGCQYLSKSKIEVYLTTAKQNYSPCSRCNPPK